MITNTKKEKSFKMVLSLKLTPLFFANINVQISFYCLGVCSILVILALAHREAKYISKRDIVLMLETWLYTFICVYKVKDFLRKCS